jgi:tetratricopeptide (TPR) repeat protein
VIGVLLLAGALLTERHPIGSAARSARSAGQAEPRGWGPAALSTRERADSLHQEAIRLLESANAAEAEVKVREALAQSQRFVPEEEIGKRPDRGLLFEDMIREARLRYRERRARYFRTLGDALAARKMWPASRKAYRRALLLAPAPGVSHAMSLHPDLDVKARLDLLLDAYLAPGGDRSALEKELLETGVFLDRNALKASLDRKRFGTLQERYPDLDLLEGAFPDFQASADGGPLIPSQLFRAGASLIVYLPVDGCGRCSEELDGLALPVLEARKRKLPLEVAAFVPESDLPGARRIVRLLSMPVRVARKDSLPEAVSALEGGEFRVVARGGMTQIRIATASLASGEIRPRVAAALAFLEEPGLPTEARPEDASVPIVTLPRLSDKTNERRLLTDWIAAIEKLEAGPAPLDSFYADLNRAAQRITPKGRAEALELLKELSRIKGAHAAKGRFLGLAGERVGERLLESAKALDPKLLRTPAGEEGSFFLAIAGRRIFLQRSFHTDESLRNFDFVLEEEAGSLAVRFRALRENAPLGVEAVGEGAAFFFDCPAKCPGARLWAEGKVVFEGGPVATVEGALVELRRAIVDAPPAGIEPYFYRRAGSTEESSLERGLRLFGEGDFRGARVTFEEAQKEIDPVAPYDLSDLLYNRARALEGQGKRREALDLFRSLGDVPYQSLVDERARAIESGR